MRTNLSATSGLAITALAITAEEGRRLAAEIPALGALIQREAADRSNTD